MPVLTCTTVWLVYSVFMIVNSSTTNNFNTFDVTLGEEERVEQPTPFYSQSSKDIYVWIGCRNVLVGTGWAISSSYA